MVSQNNAIIHYLKHLYNNLDDHYLQFSPFLDFKKNLIELIKGYLKKL